MNRGNHGNPFPNVIGLSTLLLCAFCPHFALLSSGLEEVINYFPSRKFTAFG